MLVLYMPYKTRKVRNKKCYTVYKSKGKRKVFSKCATKENAIKQIRLLRALQFNKNFNPNSRRVKKGGKKNFTKKRKLK